MINSTIAVITVVYNNYTVLEDFFTSLKNQPLKNFHLFIADASSQREPIEPKDFDMTIIPVDNKGYAHGVNAGLQKAIQQNIDHFIVINDDVYFQHNFLEETQKGLANHSRSIIGGKIYYAPGYEFHKNKYTENEKGKVLWFAGGTVNWNHALTHHVGVDEVDNGQYEDQKETEFITGCFMAFDKEVINDLGFWDEKYFLYYEDADFCERAKQKKIPLIYNPKITLWHKNAQSTDGSGSELHQKFQTKAQLRFALKYAPFRTKFHILKNYFLPF